ncbi:MAG: tRNA pseudouridine(38-40) synthase TruA [Proteobacteria bacterium]|nr:tRNA pseudouridine(38-40) synthase TruA [Pseudomonadota bacterium]
MRNVKLIIAYDGTDYKGWQIQTSEPTIQGVIEEKLGIILNQQTRIAGSGRTDAGVHALNQVAHFIANSKIEPELLKKGLNSLLPPDIVLKELSEVDADFHARYSAKSRVYKYLIWRGDTFSPFYRRFSWQMHYQLDLEEMRKAAECLVGLHDFASFQGTGSASLSSEREIMRFTIRGRAKGWIVTTIEASAFLRHMVRNIMGTLIEVGKGSMTVAEFRNIFASKDRSRAGITAPPQGLFLKKVKY